MEALVGEMKCVKNGTVGQTNQYIDIQYMFVYI